MKPLYFLLLISSVVILSSNSCRKGGPCEEPPDINVSSLVIRFIDKQTGKYLYTETNPLYNRDSLKAFDSLGNLLVPIFALNQIPGSLDRYYVVSAGPIYNSQTDAVSFTKEICKDFIIKYKYNETDTVKVCFKSQSRKCGSVFETLKVFYKGGLIGSTTNETYLLVTFYKN